MKNILLLHGALGVADDLTQLDGSLKNAGFITHSFSFSGHSNTPFNAFFGIEQFASELEMFIKQNNLKLPTVFGYSMGGFVAMYLALKQKDLIANIITLGTKFNWSKETVEKETKMLNPSLMLEKVPAFAKVLETKHGPQWKELVLKTAAMMQELGEKDLLNPESLTALNAPLLIGLADKDQMVSLEETVAVFKKLPNASMYMLPKSKHQVESINTDLLASLISNFVVGKA